jgi:ferredoxin-like protein FixX
MPRKLNSKEFIKRARRIHGDKYDYSKVEYIDSKTKIIIICPFHGIFFQIPNDHLSKKGCKECGTINSAEKRSSSKIDFTEKAKIIHGDKYNYFKVKYKRTYIKIEIICKKHGSFFQTPHKHLAGRGCPKCSSSKGEEQIRNYLIKNSIVFEEQKRFKECRDVLPLPFDFFIPDYNTLIEYDGELHFYKSRRVNGPLKLNKTILHDKIKNNFCIKNRIKLIRISFDLKENVGDILDKSIKRSF